MSRTNTKHHSQTKLSTLTPQMLGLVKKIPHLKAQAAQVRALVPVILDMANAFLSDGDQVQHAENNRSDATTGRSLFNLDLCTAIKKHGRTMPQNHAPCMSVSKTTPMCFGSGPRLRKPGPGTQGTHLNSPKLLITESHFPTLKSCLCARIVPVIQPESSRLGEKVVFETTLTTLCQKFCRFGRNFRKTFQP